MSNVKCQKCPQIRCLHGSKWVKFQLFMNYPFNCLTREGRKRHIDERQTNWCNQNLFVFWHQRLKDVTSMLKINTMVIWPHFEEAHTHRHPTESLFPFFWESNIRFMSYNLTCGFILQNTSRAFWIAFLLEHGTFYRQRLRQEQLWSLVESTFILPRTTPNPPVRKRPCWRSRKCTSVFI